ncbi:MAG: transporter substrate-binding domain-containing protein [Eubacterium sp.]|nr:transporter substrate-binding domain-containing protein [Eubacterium sp.]
MFSKVFRVTAVLFSLMIMTIILVSVPSVAQDRKTVRVGWHEEPYFITDENGRCSGYTYDYQQKIAAYTGWKYDYVKGSWDDLLEMLKKGEIDMMGNLSYMEDRAKDILYSSMPMGTETYYLFADPGNQDIRSDDYKSLNGKKIGVRKDTIQSTILKNWISAHGVSAEIVEMTGEESVSLDLIGTEIDAYVTMDVYANNKVAVPVWKIGSSDFFFAVSKSRPELMDDLNYALNRIQDENRFFSQQLHEKYLKSAETELYVTDMEKKWLEGHGKIRVGYQTGYLAFCSADEEGNLTGALKDYLDYASTAMANADLEFEAVSFPNVSDAIEALKRGEIDCVFPANMTYYDSEELGVTMTPPLMSTEMDAVVRADSQKEFLKQKKVTVCVNEGNTNYELFLKEHFPTWQIKYFEDTPTGLEAIAAGEADCVIISNYRFSNISKQCKKLHLTTVYTGVDMDYYFAVNRGEKELYSILSRVTSAVPDAAVHTALTYYSTEDVKTDIVDNIEDNLFIIMTIVAVILAVIVFLLFRSMRAQKKVHEEERVVESLNKKVYVDALTSVRNKRAFDSYLNGIQERIDGGEKVKFAICMLDCDNLKSVNDLYGHERGNEYLRNSSTLICRVFEHSPVFRVGGDEFCVIMENADFDNREELIREFEMSMDETFENNDNMWEHIRISMGYAVYDKNSDATVRETLNRADKLMYAHKRAAKNGGQ